MRIMKLGSPTIPALLPPLIFNQSLVEFLAAGVVHLNVSVLVFDTCIWVLMNYCVLWNMYNVVFSEKIWYFQVRNREFSTFTSR